MNPVWKCLIIPSFFLYFGLCDENMKSVTVWFLSGTKMQRPEAGNQV